MICGNYAFSPPLSLSRTEPTAAIRYTLPTHPSEAPAELLIFQDQLTSRISLQDPEL